MFKLNTIKTTRRQRINKKKHPCLVMFGLEISPLCAFSPAWQVLMLIVISEITLQWCLGTWEIQLTSPQHPKSSGAWAWLRWVPACFKTKASLSSALGPKHGSAVGIPRQGSPPCAKLHFSISKWVCKIDISVYVKIWHSKYKLVIQVCCSAILCSLQSSHLELLSTALERCYLILIYRKWIIIMKSPTRFKPLRKIWLD